MQAKLPELFGRLPKAGFEVAAVPEYLEKTSADAYYEAGTPDGSRPGRIRVDTYNPRTAISPMWSRLPITKVFPDIICRSRSPRS
jgi:uncharacterized protein (DUF885 family)